MEISLGLVGMVVGVLSSLLAEFVPGWADFQYKRHVLLGLNLLVPVAVWLLVCPAELPLPVTVDCSTEGLFAAIGIGITAALGNQGVYKLAVKPFVADRRR